MKQLLGKTLGNYHLKRILGQGRMGVVYLANDKALLRPTALKLMAWSMKRDSKLDPIKWFLSEARSVARISHPNVIQIYNIAKHESYRYIAMEYIDGDSIEKVLEKYGHFSPKRATDVLVQICDALEAAHQVGVIHRDIKPANLLLRKDGIVKLSDFGMAMNSYTNTDFSASMRVGTPFFNAPETWAGGPASAASDLYALGVTYYLLLTGRLPFSVHSMEELRAAHLVAPPLDPRVYVPSLPALCSEIIVRCLSKKPYMRYASATELGVVARKLYEQLSRSNQVSTVPISSVESTRRRIKHTEFKSATGFWQEKLHFSIEPFHYVSPLSCPYNGAPFDVLLDSINKNLGRKTNIIFVHGDSGSGKTTLLARHALHNGPGCKFEFLHREAHKPSYSVIKELCKLARIDSSSIDWYAELSKWLRDQVLSDVNHFLLYLDNVVLSSQDVRQIKQLGELVADIPRCHLIVSLPTWRLCDVQKEAFSIPNYQIALLQLSLSGVAEYIQKWLHKSRSSQAPLLLFSKDAVFWVAHKSQGNLRRINQMVRSMLTVSSQSGLSVISSWVAWYCGEMIDSKDRLAISIPKCPLNWPTDDVCRILNECRQKAGVPLLAQEGVNE